MTGPGRSASALDGLAEYIDHFRARVVQDAVTEAMALTWRRRARTFEACVPRPEDFNGQASEEELAARRERLEETARACYHRASISLIGGQP